MSEPQGRIQVLDKAAALIERLAEHGEASAVQLAEWIGEPRSSVYRLLDGLRAIGWVEPGGRRGTYRLGLGLFRVGSRVTRRFDERAAARPVMERLHAHTEQTIFLTIRSGFEGVCIERVDGRWVQNMALQLGGSLPLHVGAGPRVLLAAADDEFVEHPGNAGRPRTIKPRPIVSMHRPSGWSRSFVLASLRALHLDQRLRSGALRKKRALSPVTRSSLSV